VMAERSGIIPVLMLVGVAGVEVLLAGLLRVAGAGRRGGVATRQIAGRVWHCWLKFWRVAAPPTQVQDRGGRAAALLLTPAKGRRAR
jgi:hypothetical protein